MMIHNLAVGRNYSTAKALLVAACLWSGNIYADQSALDNFLANSKTMRANFSQTIITGKKSRTTTGTMEISRPNKFRWEYTRDKQLIISDAQKIYIYDQPLQQVTVKKLGSSLDKSPAAVLAGANNIHQLYNVSSSPSTEGGLHWVKIEPKQQNENNGFQLVQMGFDAQQKLGAMQFTDSFGNQTSLKFTNLQTGIKLPDSDFKFTPPAGVDVAEQ